MNNISDISGLSISGQSASSRKISTMSTDSFTEERFDSFPMNITQKEPNFGMLFDIDGVLMRGQVPLPEAKAAFDLLRGKNGNVVVPVAFVTNASSLPQAKVDLVMKTFNIELTTEQMIMAPSPLASFTQWHEHRVLVIGQGDVIELAELLGFKDIVTIEQVAAAYPVLDMVDHDNRKRLAKGYTTNHDFGRIEAIILLGEPVRWESHLQLIIDLLVTDGKPDRTTTEFPEKHLPLLACNMDLVYMAEAALPRFGHGAFLVCLESLYERISGHRLEYTAIIGKPSEITYRFAEHILSKASKRMGYTRPIRKLYFFGDNPDVDILGSNLYNMYLRRYRRLSGGRDVPQPQQGVLDKKAAVATSRTVPADAAFLPQSARAIDSVLVHTGVYKPEHRTNTKNNKPMYCHRDFLGAADLVLPSIEVETVLQGMQTILFEERFKPTLV